MQGRRVEERHRITELLDDLIAQIEMGNWAVAKVRADLLVGNLRWLVTSIPVESTEGMLATWAYPAMALGMDMHRTRILGRQVTRILGHIADGKLELALMECRVARKEWTQAY
jgi:hypothetical protein